MAKKLYVPNPAQWSIEFRYQLQKINWRIQTTSEDADYSAEGVSIIFQGQKPYMVEISGCAQQFMLPHSDAMSLIVGLQFWNVVFGKREGDWVDKAYEGLP